MSHKYCRPTWTPSFSGLKQITVHNLKITLTRPIQYKLNDDKFLTGLLRYFSKLKSYTEFVIK